MPRRLYTQERLWRIGRQNPTTPIPPARSRNRVILISKPRRWRQPQAYCPVLIPLGRRFVTKKGTTRKPNDVFESHHLFLLIHLRALIRRLEYSSWMYVAVYRKWRRWKVLQCRRGKNGSDSRHRWGHNNNTTNNVLLLLSVLPLIRKPNPASFSNEPRLKVYQNHTRKLGMNWFSSSR